ncbi:hypothetical protein [Pseudoalteromonas spongiae]|uniref:DUF4760 domain-containing protein n=1 Tax=Pseudoalteromonas spongiae TaxID=298657 RepID=A0ABU8ESG8_9GAMM
MSFIITGLASLLGASLAAIFTHYFTVKRKRTDELSALKYQAYVDFVLAASKLMSARRLGHTETSVEELSAINDAKTRICLFGDAEIVAELSEFWHRGGTLELEEEVIAFTSLCNQIRESIGYERFDLRKQDIELSNILFKLEPSNYSFKKENKPCLKSSSD